MTHPIEWLRHPRALGLLTWYAATRGLGLGRLTTDSVKTLYDDRSGRDVETFETKRNIVRAVNGQPQTVSRLEYLNKRWDEMASRLNEFEPRSVLEVGAGELTTMVPLSERVDAEFTGIDLSFDRIVAGVEFFSARGASVVGLQASAYALPFAANSFDVVYTCHALEVMPRRFGTAIREALRVSRGNILLFEPTYELGSMAQKVRMRRVDYVRGIPKFVYREPGIELESLTLLRHGGKPNNCTACYHIRRSGD